MIAALVSKASVAFAVVLCLSGTPQAWGALLVSAEFQVSSAAPNDFSGDEALAVGLDPAFSGGTPWNRLLLPAYSTTITNPSFSALIDRNTGLPTTVGFAVTGGGVVSSVQNAWTSGNAITRDIMIFGNFGGLSEEFDWQISGLTTGAAFKLVLYGSASNLHAFGSTIGANQQVDTNGDGLLTEPAVLVWGSGTGAPTGTGPVLFTGTVGPGGLIKGHAEFPGLEGDWSGFQVVVEDIVPEPSTYALSLIGLAGLGIMAWRKRWI